MQELLIVTNGFEGTWAAVEYGAWLASSMKTSVTLLGLNEEPDSASDEDYHPLEDVFERAVSLFKEKGVEYRLEVQKGEAEKIVPEKANEGSYITVVSPLGRPPLKRWLTGRSIRPLMENVRNPILYVPQVRLPLKKVLVSIGGLRYTESAENLAVQIGSVCKGDVTILHVVPPTDLDYRATREVREHLNDLIDADTVTGRNLKKSLEFAQEAGLDVKAIVRHGNVVEQILAEMKEGNYDLVCMGSSYSAHSLRQYYAPNVTAEIAEVAHCPVLTARYQEL